MFPLESERLVMRQLKETDIDWVHQLNSDPEVMRYIWACHGKARSKEEEMERLQRTIQYYDDHKGLGVFAISNQSNDAPLGWAALKHLDRSNLIEVGYRFFKNHWGRGYATECTNRLIRHGFETMGLNKIVAVTHPDNEASKHVLRKAGLIYKGEAHYYQTNCHFFEKVADQ